MFRKLVKWILNPHWVVFQNEEDTTVELGLRIWGVTFAMYKGDVYIPTQIKSIRPPAKREFGESLHPIS